MLTGAFAGVTGHVDLDEVPMLLRGEPFLLWRPSISTARDYDGPPATALALRDVLRSSLMYRFAATIPKTM